MDVQTNRNTSTITTITYLYQISPSSKDKKVENMYCNSNEDRLQNSPYFCVFKYARAVKQKVWNEAENRERDWGETLRACETRALRVHKALTPLVTDFFTDFEKKPTVLQSGSSLIVPLSVVGFCKFETTTYNMIYRFFLLVTYPA